MDPFTINSSFKSIQYASNNSYSNENEQDPLIPSSIEKVTPQSDTVELSQSAKQEQEGNKPKEGELSEDEKSEVQKLKSIDAEVKAHEMAHLAAAGAYAKGMSLEYAKGPDGQRYAVAGEVGIDTSTEDTPQKTISKMQKVMQAALAPAKPSGQDRSVASAASKAMMEAQAQLAENNAKGAFGSEDDTTETDIKTEENQKSMFSEISKGKIFDLKG